MKLMDSAFLIAASIFALITLLGLVAYYYSDLIQKKKGILDRIRNEVASGHNEGGTGKLKVTGYIHRVLSKFGEEIKPKKEGDASRIKQRLLRAGHNDENDTTVYFGAKILLALLLLAVTSILKLTVMPAYPARQFLALMMCSVLAGFYLPDYYIYRKTKARKNKIFEGFPDALDLMVVCVEAGMGLDSAIKRVGDEMALKNKVLSEEFRMLSLELRAGKPRADALRNLAMRIDLEDVSGLVTMLIQTDRFGTRISQALKVYADTMRSKRFLRAEEIAAKIPIKILFPLVLFILPALVMTMVGPGIIRVYRMLTNGSLM
jgi:tight adherence protein C